MVVVVFALFILLALAFVYWKFVVVVLLVGAVATLSVAVVRRRRLARMSPSDRAAAIAARDAKRERRRETFAGVYVGADRIESKRGSGPLAGAHAYVDSAGGYSQRLTVTRFATMGPFALAAPKKTDHRELYLIVEGRGFAFSVPLHPARGRRARDFAAKINARGSSLDTHEALR